MPFDVFKAFGYIEKDIGKDPVLLNICATYSELPFYTSTIALPVYTGPIQVEALYLYFLISELKITYNSCNSLHN